jgi:hypothetical protein
VCKILDLLDTLNIGVKLNDMIACPLWYGIGLISYCVEMYFIVLFEA